MVLLSTLRQRCPSLNLNRLLKLNPQPGVMSKRHGGHGHTFDIKPTNFNFKKAKDMWHFYTCVAILLYGPFILYANIFIGDATLVEIPEGYRPHHWEYFKHPITRLFEKRFEDPQKNYEKFLQYLYEEDEMKKMRLLGQQVDRVMKRRKDYEAHYYLPLTVPANYVRDEKASIDEDQYKMVDSIASSGFSTELGDADSDLSKDIPEMSGGVDQ